MPGISVSLALIGAPQRRRREESVEALLKAFEVNGNEIADKPAAIRYARSIAEESGKSVMVWQSGLPLLWIAPEIKIGGVKP
jgi:hypothetical protein